ncbi:unnamed protein product [Adineta ricciae]|uniref:SEP domain-containing protein n=1 Tax=Adineta ricciae TaxID=249248 RepID=A0A815VBR8_ADIRI|nr:unnamed protein product [Adineta ricciae]
MAMRSKEQIMRSFIDITGCDVRRAQNFLRAVDWNEQDAVALFLDTNETEQPSPPSSDPGEQPLEDSSETTRSKRNIYQFTDDLPKNAIEGGSRVRFSNEPPTVHPIPIDREKTNIASKIHAFQNWRQQLDNSDDSDDEGQAFYAGGSERSGQQIIGPPKDKDNNKRIANVFDAARRQGARETSDGDDETASSYPKREPFSGTGYSLNDNPVPSYPQDASASVTTKKVEQVPIRFYSNGFTVGDGELRSFEENREFIEYIKRGEMPPELRSMNSNGQQIEVSLEDHRGEEYKRVAPTFKPFTGTGHTIGAPRSNQAESDTLDLHRLEDIARQRLRRSISSSTIIRLRLPDISTPLCIPIDLHRTLADVRKFLTENIPSLQSNTFEFMEPPSTRIQRDDENQRIKDSKLSNSMLVVRRTG